MKLRVNGDSVRFRLSTSEAARLCAGEAITCETRFLQPAGATVTFTYSVAPSPAAAESRIDLVPFGITLVLSTHDLKAFHGAGSDGVRIHKSWTDEFGALNACEAILEKDRRES